MKPFETREEFVAFTKACASGPFGLLIRGEAIVWRAFCGYDPWRFQEGNVPDYLIHASLLF